MHPTLKKAIDRANELIDGAMASTNRKAERREALLKMSVAELVAIVAKHEKLDKTDVVVHEVCGAILCDEDCSWLSYGMICAIVRDRIPGINTTEANVAWYAADYRNERGADVQLRKPQKEITKLIMKG